MEKKVKGPKGFLGKKFNISFCFYETGRMFMKVIL